MSLIQRYRKSQKGRKNLVHQVQSVNEASLALGGTRRPGRSQNDVLRVLCASRALSTERTEGLSDLCVDLALTALRRLPVHGVDILPAQVAEGER